MSKWDECAFHRGLLLGIAERVHRWPLAHLHDGYRAALAVCSEPWARRLEEDFDPVFGVYPDAEAMMREGIGDFIFDTFRGSAVRQIPKELAVSELNGMRRPSHRDTALRLARAFGTTAELWLNLQQAYDIVREQVNAQRARSRARIKSIDLCKT